LCHNLLLGPLRNLFPSERLPHQWHRNLKGQQQQDNGS
jgi:hypothetical protein